MNNQHRFEDQRRKFAAWSDAQARAEQARHHSDGNAWQAASWEAQCAMQQWMNSAGMGHEGVR